MKKSIFFSQLLTACLTGLGAILIYLFSLTQTFDKKTTFILLSSLLLVYLFLEIKRLHCLHPTRWLINPIVLCSLMTFVLGFGISNILYFLPEDLLIGIGLFPEITPSMNKLLLLVIAGAIAIWQGYWSSLARKLYMTKTLLKLHNKFFKINTQPKYWVLPALIFISMSSRLFQIKLGVFGYSSDYYALIDAGKYTQYLAMGASLGKIALVIATCQYYSSYQYQAKLWFLTIVIIEIVFGLLSGFKSAVVIPLIIILLCQYLRRGRVSRTLFITIPFVLMFAYAVIEPFRAIKNEDAGFNNTSLIYIVNTMVHAISSDANTHTVEDNTPFIIHFMGRSNLTYIGSLGVKFSDENDTLPNGSPNFLKNIIFSPLYAWVPRFIWTGKPLGNIGLWYTQTVMGLNILSSTGMSPFTYLYFSGGVVAVFLGFFFIGCIQRVLFFITQPSKSSSGTLVVLSMLPTLVIISSAFDGIFITLFRELPIILFLQSFFYSRIQSKK